MNLGGYVVEVKAKLPCLDVVVANPTKEEIKIDSPVYNIETIEGYKKLGLIVVYVIKEDSLAEVINKVKQRMGVKK